MYTYVYSVILYIFVHMNISLKIAKDLARGG